MSLVPATAVKNIKNAVPNNFITIRRIILKKLMLISLFVFMTALQTSFADTANPMVTLETTHGTITLELKPKDAPRTVENFIQYVKSGAYDNTIFHRVIKGFMIQGGGLTEEMKRTPTYKTIKNEAHHKLKNLVGTISMARTQDPHSATNQFFINTGNNGSLDFVEKNQRGWGYCVFGNVVDGMDVVKTIESQKTGIKSGRRDVPLSTVFIKKATILPRAKKDEKSPIQ
jgi:peptidyl-prolyl cis-trans isomerase B (cyclophilin B)